MHLFSKLNNRNRSKRLTVTSVLLLALAVATPVLQAQDWDQIYGRDKVHDPTGAWLITAGNQQFSLITFQRGGTVVEDFQGESAFDPASVNPPTRPGDIQTSPQHGVWQKTGWKTFAATLVAIQAENDDDWNKLYARVKNNIEPGTDKVEYFRRWYPAFRHEAEGLAA